MVRGILTLLLLSQLATAAADEDIFDFYFHSLSLPASSQDDFQQLSQLLGYTTLEDAIVLCEQIIEDNSGLQEKNPALYGKLLANLGMILNFGEYYENSIEALDNSMMYLDRSVPQFSPQLINVIMAKASSLISLGKFEEAKQELRRAQHITHRDDGVYSATQLPIIEKLFRVSYQGGEYLDADRQQFFALRGSERAYGYDSEDLLPTLIRLGRYFADRGALTPQFGDNDLRYLRESLFRRSLELYERAVKIIEVNYGPNDPRLVEPLQGLSRTRLMQRTNNKSEEALERALYVIESNPTTDLPDRIDAIIRLGDLYTLTSDSRAGDLYLRAWNLMHENADYNWLKVQAFGTPTRLYPRAQSIVYLDRRPNSADGDSELFIDAEYTVKVDGRVGDVKLLGKNVPNDQVRRLRSQLAASRFRPRIVQGELVETKNLIIHQRFRVAGHIEKK